MEYTRLFIISSHAGNRNVSLLQNKIMQLYKKEGSHLSYRIEVTTHQTHAQELALEFSKKYQDKGIVYVCGGDGTLGEVANVLAHTPTPMGLIPYGTANDFAKSIYGSIDMEAPLQKTLTPSIAPIDILGLNYMEETTKKEIHTHCINILSFGLDSRILVEVYHILEKFPLLRSNAYFVAIIKSLFPLVAPKYKIRLTSQQEEKEYEDNYLLGTFCNGSYYGNGFQPIPLSPLDDGIMEVCLIKKLSQLEVIPLIAKYRKAKHIHSKKVELLQCTDTAHITSDKDIILGNYDGTLFRTKSLQIQVHHKGLLFAK